jgi:putative PIG3 family NAD(P)H quinone oxidoreductase
MKAIVPVDDALVWRDVPDPVPGAGEALLRVRAAGVNRADLVQRAGRYPPPPGASDILGLEVAGEVLTAPAGSGWKPGDRAYALLAGGGYAEQVAVPHRMLMPVPERLSFDQAASLAEVHLTAFLNLFLEAGLRAGERLLVHGGASGVGTAAIQQARRAGARVATTSSAPKRDACRALGAELALDRRDPAWPARLRDAWDGVDVILDMVGADTSAAAFELLDTGGRLVWIAALSGSRLEVDVRTLMRKRLTLKGSTLRSRPLAEKITLRDAFLARFGSDVERGRIVPVIHEVLPVEEAERAHGLLRADATIGKVVLRVGPG